MKVKFEYFNSSTLQSRTTSATYSCSKNTEKLDEELLFSKPLPWVVKVYFESENSINGVICSGKYLNHKELNNLLRF